MDVRLIPTEELRKIIADSICWSEAMRKVGKSPRGASFQFFQSRVRKLGIDTSHFLGKAAHAGIYQTGICKKKHWSDILIKNKSKERERSQQFRRAFTEYCEEKNIPIQCVDCKNNGTWIGKKLILEINHKDDQRWNNIPENLEWVCPNCHSLKTIY